MTTPPAPWQADPSTYAKVVRSMLAVYKGSLSPFIGQQCRFAPSCSVYTAEALITHGFFKGSLLGLSRICRCNPWGGSGYDPVPLREGRVWKCEE